MNIQTKQQKILLAVLMGMCLLAHLLTATHYPMFRDEFYYLDCAKHLDWGYVDQPPLSIALLDAWRGVLGDSLFAVRLAPALAAMLLLFLTWKLTAELGGGTFARVLAAVAAFISPQQRALAGFYSMNAFDLCFFACAALLVVRMAKSGHSKYWIPVGIVVGLGLLNKIGLLYFGAGLALGLAATPLRRQFLKPQLWIGAGLAVLLFLPYVLWQSSHDYATLEFIRNATAHKNVAFSPPDFLKELTLENNPLTLLVWLPGLFALFFWKPLRDARILGWIVLGVLLILMTQHGKPYYAAGLFPILCAPGAVWMERLLSSASLKWARPALVVLMIVGGAALMPFGLRVLSPPDYVRYQRAMGLALKASEYGHREAIWPQHWADSYGWIEQVQAVERAYRRLSAAEQRNAVVMAGNYGEAGAVNYYGARLGLPHAYSAHNSCYYWGPPETTGGTTYLLILPEDENPRDVFSSAAPVDSADAAYAMPYERHRKIWVCRLPRIPLADLWEARKDFD
jgi:4-amino-4-deoxy-L-arabinose transferase-like glycosyltransferase